MHSKTHFKSPFKSSKISTELANIIFFINTTLHPDPNKIWTNRFGSTQLHLSIFKDTHETGNKWASFLSWCHWQAGPTGQLVHLSTKPKQSRGRRTMLAWPDLIDGEFASGDIYTAGPPRPPGPIDLLGRASCRSYARWRHSWRHGGAGRRRYAGDDLGGPT